MVDCGRCMWMDTESCNGDRVVDGKCHCYTDVSGEYKRRETDANVSVEKERERKALEKDKRVKDLTDKVFGVESEKKFNGYEIRMPSSREAEEEEKPNEPRKYTTPYGINTFIVSTQPEKILNEYDEADETGRVWRVKVIK